MVNHGDDVLQRAEVLLEQPGLDLDLRHKGLSAEEWAIRSGNPALATLIASEVSWSDTMRGGVTIGETTPATITMRPSVLLLRSHRWWIASRPIFCGFHILILARGPPCPLPTPHWPTGVLASSMVPTAGCVGASRCTCECRSPDDVACWCWRPSGCAVNQPPPPSSSFSTLR